jgi:hypothetical protein
MQQVQIIEQADVVDIVSAAISRYDSAIVQPLATRVAKLEAAQAPPSGDLPGWRLIFEDTFGVDVPLGSFPVPGGRWGAYPTTYKDTSKNGTYDAAKTIWISGGMMHIEMYTDVNGIVHVSAPVPYIRPPSSTQRWPGQLYGRYEAIARFPALATGYKVAWLLWPDSGTNTTHIEGGVSVPGGNGEIDFPEHNLNQSGVTQGFMHYQGATVGNDQYSCAASVPLANFHSFVTEWSRDLCRFLVDGREVGRTTQRVPNTPMHYVLQCETQLSGGKPPVGAVAEIEIDSVRVWAPA